MRSIFLRILALIILAFVSQDLRFENKLAIKHLRDGKFSVRIDDQLFEIDKFTLPAFDKISLVFQKSAVGQSGLISFDIKDQQSHTKVFNLSKRVFYLFGRVFSGDLLAGNFQDRGPSLGDWSIDRYNSDPFTVELPELPEDYTLNFNFIGRGDKFLSLGENPKLAINIRDGYIDSDFSVCLGAECAVATSLSKGSINSLQRILGVFVEIALLGVFLSIITAICVKLFSFRNYNLGTRFFPFILAAASLVIFLSAAIFGFYILGGIPHIPDSSVYYRQAIMLSQGYLKLPFPDFAAREVIMPNGAVDLGGFFSFHYNHFWPAILSIGIAMNIPGLVNPLLAALSVVLLYRIASKLFDRSHALLAACLAAFSPFLVIIAGDYLTHTACAFFFLLSLELLLTLSSRPGAILSLLAGISWGIAFGIRQGTILALSSVLLIYLFHKKKLPKGKRVWSGLLCGIALMLIVYCLDNWLLTANPFVSPYSKYHSLSLSPANLQNGLSYADASLAYLTPILFGPRLMVLIWALIFLPLIFRSRAEDWYLFGSFLSLVILQAFLNNHGMHGYGPRFFYEGIFFLFLLCARGLLLLCGSLPKKLLFVCLPVLIIFCAITLKDNFQAAQAYRNYNGIDSDYFKSIQKEDLNKTIIVSEDSYWQGLDIMASLWDPTFKTALIIKKMQDGSHLSVLDHFPERQAKIRSGNELIDYKVQGGNQR